MNKLSWVLMVLTTLSISMSVTAQSRPDIRVLDTNVSENAGRVSVVVELSAPATVAIPFGLATQRDTATNGNDFFGRYERLEFSPGQTRQQFTVVILNDAVRENTEAFRVNLSSVNGLANVTNQQAVVTIVDDDGPISSGDESYGSAPPPARSGPGWSAVDRYFRENPRLAGECSQAVHDEYWVRGADGNIHPTWHPVIDPSGCSFAHDHGDDPRSSDIYAFSERIPFGMAQAANGNPNPGPMRHEDHVGHKITVQNNWYVVEGNPQHGDKPNTDIIKRTDIQCDWLSKVHQGSHSKDALGNNAHEYFLNISCSDGVKLRNKQLQVFGPAEKVTELCTDNQQFPSGVDAMSPVPVINYLDGKREFNCISHFLNQWLPETKARRLEELWKPDGVIQFPGGGYINFSPYYVVFNPARYMDHKWMDRNAQDSFISSVNLCFDDPGRNVFRGVTPRWCDEVPQSVANAAPDLRIAHPDNPMNGTRRLVHPKGLQLDTLNVNGSGSEIRFCTNAFGQEVRVLGSGQSCNTGEIEQLVSRSKRGWGMNGSDVNSFTDADGNLRGAGYLNEWVRDFSGETTIRYPN